MPVKKMVFIHLFNDRSGSPKVLSQVIKAAADNNIATEVITSAHGDGFLSGVADIQSKLFYKRSENKLLTLGYYVISQALLFIQCLKYKKQNVVFYVNTMMPFGAALAGKLRGIPVYYHVHETSIKPNILKKFLRFIIEKTSTKVVFVSHYLMQAERFARLPQIVIHNALDALDATPFPIKEEAGFTCLMICSLKAYKGVHEFLALARRSQNDKNLNFTLVLNASRTEIDSYFSGVDVPGNLAIYPRQIDMSDFYSRSDLLLNLSRPDGWIETFGLTILEGMSHGLPVIVPPVGGPAELVRSDVEGYLISSYDIEELYRTICRISSDPKKYKLLSDNALSRTRDFSLQAFEDKFLKLFNEMQHDV
ncbi:glycosyltransferase family 4 protein [Pseudomonas sp. 10S4]|uniref:glycosyltransferase family 4 protein n=1 Tax=Pseudomonas sp. 10S4 TaxID=3048583 RepID=UPI002AC90733|nr:MULTISPECIES: glycosyltransferase family 4 protein [unclassified Pseudomonas]MEB0225205.1 glycosyltransferase family 4 protein [Pseudomonas sp. 5S1]MEB0294001.1 glycosyltransferase family 4 protein [Pseudomonas sp. 10S4]WPX17004.1 glycosyltransferase family 4 protein [Pseudomonas sp. 10S4]